MKRYDRSPEDHFGLDPIFRQLYPSLCFLAGKITDDEAIAQDIVQDSFIKWWQLKQQGKAINNDRAYLFACVRNEALSFLRQTRRTEQEIARLAYIHFEANENRMQEMIQTEMIGLLYEAVKNLPPRCRSVFELSLREGKSIREVATILKLSPNAISKLRTRGITLLRKYVSTLLTCF